MNRRSFFGAAFAGLAASSPAKPKPGDIPTRTLGRTGQKLTCIGMGGARFHLIPFDEGTSLVRRAYDLGINYFDMARSYNSGHAEEVYGCALEAFTAAKKAGKCRFIGFTRHADPAFNLQMLRSHDGFDTMLMPLHVPDTVYLSFEKGALPAAVERGIGVRDCIRYTLSLPVTACPLGFTTIGPALQYWKHKV